MSVNPNRESITRPETSNKETLKQNVLVYHIPFHRKHP